MADVDRSPGPQCSVDWPSEVNAVGEETVGSCSGIEVAGAVQVLAIVIPHGAVVGVGEDIDPEGVGDLGKPQDVVPVRVRKHDG